MEYSTAAPQTPKDDVEITPEENDDNVDEDGEKKAPEEKKESGAVMDQLNKLNPSGAASKDGEKFEGSVAGLLSSLTGSGGDTKAAAAPAAGSPAAGTEKPKEEGGIMSSIKGAFGF